VSKIIIYNESRFDDAFALDKVKSVLAEGRISNNNTQYCYATTFKLSGVAVLSGKNKHSDVFWVQDYEQTN
jgi:hypothetical protein